MNSMFLIHQVYLLSRCRTTFFKKDMKHSIKTCIFLIKIKTKLCLRDNFYDTGVRAASDNAGERGENKTGTDISLFTVLRVLKIDLYLMYTCFKQKLQIHIFIYDSNKVVFLFINASI